MRSIRNCMFPLTASYLLDDPISASNRRTWMERASINVEATTSLPAVDCYLLSIPPKLPLRVFKLLATEDKGIARPASYSRSHHS